MTTRKTFLSGLLALLAGLFLFTSVLSADASVSVVSQTYEQSTGDFTLNVKATEPWVVYRTVDLVHWERVSKVMGTGQKSWTDYGAGLERPIGFYVAVPKNRKPHQNEGNHFGWYVDQNPHNPAAE